VDILQDDQEGGAPGQGNEDGDHRLKEAVALALQILQGWIGADLGIVRLQAWCQVEQGRQ
jgi:hypothetical protein